ncbi:MAG: hypothetical protein DRO40_08180 [Thermoprotei archaeon]|nr:MAG: hypothetical protein DRO40_08180 [Thermoprotei archaeon]
MRFNILTFTAITLIVLIFLLSVLGYGIDLRGDYGGVCEQAFSFAYTLTDKGFEAALHDFIIASKVIPVTFDRFLIFIASLPYIFITKLVGVIPSDIILISNIIKLSIALLKLLCVYVLLCMFLQKDMDRRLIILSTITIFVLDNYWLSSLLSDAIDRPLMQLYSYLIAIIYSYIFFNGVNVSNLLILTLISWLIPIYHPHTILIALALSIAFIIAYLIFNPKRTWVIIYSQTIMLSSYLLHVLHTYPLGFGYERSIISYILSQKLLGMGWFNSFLILNTEKSSWFNAQSIGYLNLVIIISLVLLSILAKHTSTKFRFSKAVFLSLLALMLSLVNYHVYSFIQLLIYEFSGKVFLFRALSRFYSLYGLVITYGIISVLYILDRIRTPRFIRYIKIMKNVSVKYGAPLVLLIVVLSIYAFNSSYLLAIQNYVYINSFYSTALDTYYDVNNEHYGVLVLYKMLPHGFTLNAGAYDVFQTNDIMWSQKVVGNYVYKLFGIRYVIQNNGSISRFHRYSRINTVTGILIPLTSLQLGLKSMPILDMITSCLYRNNSSSRVLENEILDLRKVVLNETNLKTFTVITVFRAYNLNRSLSSILALGNPAEGTGFRIAQDYDFLVVEMNLNGKWIKIASPRVLHVNSTYVLVMVFDGDKGYLSLYLNGINVLKKSGLQGSVLAISRRAYIGNTPNGKRPLEGEVYFAGIMFRALKKCEVIDILRYLLTERQFLKKFEELRLPLMNVNIYSKENYGIILPMSFYELFAESKHRALDQLHIPVIILFDNLQDLELVWSILSKKSEIIPFYSLVEKRYLENLLTHKCVDPLIRLGVVSPIDHRIFNTFSIVSYKYDKVLFSDKLVAVNPYNYVCFNELTPRVTLDTTKFNRILLRALISGKVVFNVLYSLPSGKTINETVTISTHNYEAVYIDLTPTNIIGKNHIVDIKLLIKYMEPSSLVVFDSLALMKNSFNFNSIQEQNIYYIKVEARKDLLGKIWYDLVLDKSTTLRLFQVFGKNKNIVITIYNPGYKQVLYIDRCRHLMKTKAGFDVFLCSNNHLVPMHIGIMLNTKLQIAILLIENSFNILSFILILIIPLRRKCYLLRRVKRREDSLVY